MKVKTIDFFWQTCFEESKNGSIGRKDHDHDFLEFTRHNLHQLSGEKKRSQDNIIPLCWIDYTLNLWKNSLVWRRKKCCSTTTMHQFTRSQLQWPNLSNCAINCFLIHPILQIWPLATFFFFQMKKWIRWRNRSLKKDSHWTRLLQKQTPILQSSRNRKEIKILLGKMCVSK